MAEQLGDKTEAPTPKRRTEAREQGQIARSHDLTAAALMIGFLLLMQSFGPGLVKALKELVAQFLGSAALNNSRIEGIGQMITGAVIPVAKAALPLLLGAMVIAIVVNILQVGLFFNTKRLMPNLGALNPFRGAGRLLAGPNIVQLGMNVVKMLLIGALAWSAIQDRLGQIIAAQQLDFIQAFGLGAKLIYSIAMRISVFLLLLAIVDYAYQRFRIEKELKMTKQEVKEEMRSMEGDPKIKSRRRQIAIQMAQQRIKKNVPTADVVVTNPTEFAVALKYDADAMHAPRVVAKGRGPLARHIREVAIAHGIPIIERKPLARALYKLVEVGQEIPEQLYSAVAEILAYVYELTGKLRKKQTA